MIQKLSDALKKAPSFLKGTKIEMLSWSELQPGAKPNGHADSSWNSIDFSTPLDESFERVLVHEIAHLWDEADHSVASEFLKIRFYSQEYTKALRMLWQHIQLINGPRRSEILDEKVTEILTQNNMLRRSDTDIHASDVYEYWGISVELYYHYNKIGRIDELKNVLSNDEINFLSELNWKESLD